MSRLNRTLIVLFAGLIAAACASAPAQRASEERNLLLPEEMQKLGNTTLLQAVQALRPQWLSTRGRDTFGQQGQVVVMLDGVQMGNPNFLETINSNSVATLMYFDGPTATGRWGICCGHGVIYITSLGGRRSPI